MLALVECLDIARLAVWIGLDLLLLREQLNPLPSRPMASDGRLLLGSIMKFHLIIFQITLEQGSAASW
jgi:hypothetical protein